MVFTRENRGGSAQHATRATPIREEEEEESVFIRGVNTKEEEEAMVELFYSHNRRGSTQHATRATLDDTCPN